MHPLLTFVSRSFISLTPFRTQSMPLVSSRDCSSWCSWAHLLETFSIPNVVAARLTSIDMRGIAVRARLSMPPQYILHILSPGAINLPAQTFYAAPTLTILLEKIPIVVFHCSPSLRRATRCPGWLQDALPDRHRVFISTRRSHPRQYLTMTTFYHIACYHLV